MILLLPNRTKVEMGNGDVKVTSGLIEGNGFVALNQDIPHEIGSQLATGTNDARKIVDTSNISIVFSNVKSIEVMILKLQQARALMLTGVYPDTGYVENITDLYEPNSYIDRISNLQTIMRGETE